MGDLMMQQSKLRLAWSEFVSTGQVTKVKLPNDILLSWKECKQKGVDPFQKVVPHVLPRPELERRRRLNAELLEVAIPVLRNLYDFVQGTGFILAIADHEGYLLEVMGDRSVVEQVKAGHFIPGADWSQESAGTNAIGLALKRNKPIQVHSHEHYCVCSHRWTCSAAPIHDERGAIIGVIDMTGYYDKANPHTLGMVVAAAHAIETQMAMKKAWNECRVLSTYKRAIIDSVAEGILALDRNGCIMLMNEPAARLLGASYEYRTGNSIDFLGQQRGYLATAIKKSLSLTDEETDVYFNQRKVKCTVTTRPLYLDHHKLCGTLVILNDVQRAQRLVQKITGRGAKFTFKDIVGKNVLFQETVRQGLIAARSDSNVLLLGESGTGKDVLAQAIHNESYRRNGPFVAINCGAIPREILGSELFGYVEGAFTGAKKGGNPGKFELANGGTIFLDEIGEMPLDMQTWLLRVLEDKNVMRIGGSDIIPIDVRVIAASNKDLALEVEKGRFRKDLYYRLNVITIRMIPLRERKDDIPLLIEHFLQRFNQQLGRNVTEIDSAAMQKLLDYSWPGNVRELQNVIERTINLCQESTIRLEHLPREITATTEDRPVENFEKQLITKLLRIHMGNISKVAAEMGMSRSTIYRKIRKYGILFEFENQPLF